MRSSGLIGRKSNIALFNGVISEIRHTIGANNQ
jgi:hypothetical protein